MTSSHKITINVSKSNSPSCKEFDVPNEPMLVEIANKLQQQCGSDQSLWDWCDEKCIAYYVPSHSYTVTDLDLFTGVEGESSKNSIPERCHFYIMNGSPLHFANAVFENGTVLSVRYLDDSEQERSGTLFETAKVSNQTVKNGVEGAVYEMELSRYERSSQLRDACVQHFGPVCQSCSLDFGKRYGQLAEGFIHVHHLKPLSVCKTEHAVNPITDMVPLCPNCHSVAHMRDPPLLPHEIKALLS